MPDRFRVDTANERWVYIGVLWMMSWWMVLIGTILLLAPVRRFTSTFRFLQAIPHGILILGVLYVGIGLVMVYAMRRDRQALMARLLLAGGVVNWTLGLFMLVGEILGPSGALGAPFALFFGAHMVMQSALLNR